MERQTLWKLAHVMMLLLYLSNASKHISYYTYLDFGANNFMRHACVVLSHAWVMTMYLPILRLQVVVYIYVFVFIR